MVSAIGGQADLTDPDRHPPDTGQRLMLDSLAQGLVRFDANGQVEPGLAERWIVIDDGRTYIFRLRETAWTDGRPVDAEEVAARFTRHVAPSSRNPLNPFLTAIDSAVAMTPRVVEVRLKRPRPDLLSLFAQPEMALLQTRPLTGTGPFAVLRGGPTPLLQLKPDPATIDPDEPPRAHAERNVQVIGERAAKAIARFAAKQSDLVTGGSFADWPLVALATIAPSNIRIDPAVGLFGLAIRRRAGFLADAKNRDAVSAAIDRAALLGSIYSGWTVAETLLPDRLDSAAAPAAPAWAGLPIETRRPSSAALVKAWGQPVRLSLALPGGPGATLLFGRLAAQLRAIGIALDRAPADADADLALVDAVAPYDSGRWYLSTACQPCSEGANTALDAAREAPTLAERSGFIAQADAELARDTALIPLGRPLRWSLVALRLRRWAPNARAWHPLNRLRDDPT